MKDFECDVYLDLMPLVKDGVASEASNQALQDHLAVCGKCRAQFGAMPRVPDEVLDDGLKDLKRKWNLRAALALALVAVCFLFPLVIMAVFGGNPVSEAIVRNHAADYLKGQYPGHDFEISDPKYDMKSLGYTVTVRSRFSKDTHFVLTYGYFGGDCWDGYEEFVLSGNNTFSRMSSQASELVMPVLQKALPEAETMAVGLNSNWPSIYDEFGYPFSAPEEIEIESLEIDGEYDPRKCCAQYGHLEIHLEVTEASAGKIADTLLQVYEALTEQRIAVRTLDVTVYDRETSMTVAGFLFEQIPSEDLVHQVQQGIDAYAQFQKAYEVWILKKNES